MLKEFSVSKSDAKGAPKAKLVYNMPETLSEADILFGHDVALGLLLGQLIIRLHNVMRNMLKKDISIEAIQTMLNSWKPGDILRIGNWPSFETQSRNVLENAKRMTPEIRAELLAKLIAMG
jgi:hypothetical protein